MFFAFEMMEWKSDRPSFSNLHIQASFRLSVAICTMLLSPLTWRMSPTFVSSLNIFLCSFNAVSLFVLGWYLLSIQTHLDSKQK
jgi:hypothetical protein